MRLSALASIGCRGRSSGSPSVREDEGAVGGDEGHRRCRCVKRWVESWVGVGDGFGARCGGRCGGSRKLVQTLVCRQADVVGGGGLGSADRGGGNRTWWDSEVVGVGVVNIGGGEYRRWRESEMEGVGSGGSRGLARGGVCCVKRAQNRRRVV